MVSEDWSGLAARLTKALHLAAPPIAITFRDDVDGALPAFDGTMPEPTPDGRRGRVPAGCVFWMHATERTFVTLPADHGNCSVGSLTHGLIGLDVAAGRQDVAALVESGWVSREVFPTIPTVTTRPESIVYGPLAQAASRPDVVLVRATARGVMTVSDAIPEMTIEGKPQCHIVAVAKEHGRPAASVGCALSRARTGMPVTEMTCALPGAELESIVAAIEKAASVDGTVAHYAGVDAARFAGVS